MYNPVSTYRFQFNKNFTFDTVRQLVEYLHLLGSGTVYASPVFEATPGSMHGYDITNPNRINPEIGTEEELKKLIKSLSNSRIGWLQDVVPNHTAFNHHNKWLVDVLEKGPESLFFGVFDIDLHHPKLRNKLMVPFLGDTPGNIIKRSELSLIWRDGAFFLSYFENTWPLRFESFTWLMDQSQTQTPNSLSLLLGKYRPEEKSPDHLFLNGEWEQLKTELKSLNDKDQSTRIFFENLAINITNNPNALQGLIANQHYILAHWKESEQQINFRRFFTVNELICLRMEDKNTFALYHKGIDRWLQSQMFNGLRIDHVDGLRNPGDYLAELRKLSGKKTYIVVEKILEAGEPLPDEWPVQGTSGYDFLALVNNLFTRRKGMSHLLALYHKLTEDETPPDQIAYQSKKLILSERMQGEWDNITRLFLESNLINKDNATHITEEQIKAAIGECLLAMPVYRLYSNTLPIAGHDKKTLKEVFTKALDRNPEIAPVISIMEKLLFSPEVKNDDDEARIINFFSRLMQYSGPLMAKGVEDTTMYRYTGFIGHNEVGDTAGSKGIGRDEFHHAMQQRQEKWPLTLNTTSTHDTKRGEDVRARLNIISEIPEEWEETVSQWIEINNPLKTIINGCKAPSISEEYLIYQTLTGIAPFDGNINTPFLQRVTDYMVKALREAKQNSAWNNPDNKWEEAVTTFIKKIFTSGTGFKESFLQFHKKTAHYGIFNSLSQLVLKCTCPGVPDIYRGTEFWDFTLVDPDNRQPVDFELRQKTLSFLKEQYTLDPIKLFHNLLSTPGNGHIKLWLTHRLLRFRKENQNLFTNGYYIPLTIKGILKKHVFAFARHYKNKWYISVVPLYLSLLENPGKQVSPNDVDWKNTRIILPEKAPSEWISIYTGRPFSADKEISVGEIFEIAPVGVLHADAGRKTRAAGVLMNVSSLPGRFATGDFGAEAYQFVDFLKESGHSYWQVLPFTQTTAKGGWSPYSPPSAFAGNTLFISPQKLADESLISKHDLKKAESALSEKSDFQKAFSIREALTSLAYENFMTHGSTPAKQKFHNFCQQENYWLNDYALFTILNKIFDNAPWNQWPKEFRDRNRKALQQFALENEKEYQLIKYRQYLFAQQWQALKRYANHHGIRIIGDIPIYVSYYNADVWSHQNLFNLNSEKEMNTVAGVPPDYFSETGQLWGMPIYKWHEMKKDNFHWWIKRLRQNMKLYDIVRLDHFRGFEAFWEVPADNTTAENGTWSKAPGQVFFNEVKNAFPEMPFIAEDLGDIDEDVYKLRDEFNLPGMKVLQFAFGDDLPESTHTPHNHTYNSVVYTGTHDNNTARGWYQSELDKAAKKRLKLYTGNKIKSKTIHRVLTRLAWASQAKLVIVPIQDLTGKGAEAQMNRPSVATDNWTWRVKTINELNDIAGETRELLKLFSR
jgi:malto-oligosyltrehalose synthase/4-alpha-glucanotransferase